MRWGRSTERFASASVGEKTWQNWVGFSIEVGNAVTNDVKRLRCYCHRLHTEANVGDCNSPVGGDSAELRVGHLGATAAMINRWTWDRDEEAQSPKNTCGIVERIGPGTRSEVDAGGAVIA